MTNPSVCCVCLTADRQKYTDRAVRCFLRQTYENKSLLIYDTGKVPFVGYNYPHRSVTIVRNESSKPRTIGALRNEANDMTKADVIAHWDSDDVSLPTRLGNQVADLGYGWATGYHNLLFWDSRKGCAWEYDYRDNLRKVLGTSLLYWRSTWAQVAFVENRTDGEDTEWCKSVIVERTNGVSQSLLVAEYHGGNTGNYGNTEPHFQPIFDRHKPHENPEWRRATEWDERV